MTRKMVATLAALMLIPAVAGCSQGGSANSAPTVTVTASAAAASSATPTSTPSRHCAESTAIIDGPGDGSGADLTMATLDVGDSGENLIASWELDQMPPSAEVLALSIALSSMDGSAAGQIGAHVQGGKISVYEMTPEAINVKVTGPTAITGTTVTVTVPLADVTNDYGSQFVWSAAASVNGGDDDLAPDNALDIDNPACNTFSVNAAD